MPGDRLSDELDRVSRLADPDHFEALGWSKTDGAALETIVGHARRALEDRDDLHFMEKETSGRSRHLVLTSTSINQTEIASFHFKVESGVVGIWVDNPKSGTFSVMHPGKPENATIADASEQWVRSTIRELLSSVNRR